MLETSSATSTARSRRAQEVQKLNRMLLIFGVGSWL
jgi:hypothetical protein